MSKPTIKITRKNGSFAIKTTGGGVTLNDRTVVDTTGVFGAFPVGSIYLSVNSTSPASLFGGTWEKIKDKFLLASGDTYTNGVTGGEATHTLTLDEMPTHNHRQFAEGVNYLGQQVNYYEGQTGNEVGYSYKAKGSYADYVTNGKNKSSTGETGGSQAHNNMPPYLVVNIWKRVS